MWKGALLWKKPEVLQFRCWKARRGARPKSPECAPQTAPRGGRILASSSDAIERALAGVERSSMSGELNR